MSLPHPPLLLVTDRQQALQPLAVILERAFAAGCRWASIREKDLPPEEQIELLHSLMGLARSYQATLTLHGAPALAHAGGADGVHLAAGSDVGTARALLGSKALIGISIHSAEEAACLDPDLIDYAILGPIFDTASKPGYGPGLGVEGIRAARRVSRVPIVAIGGLTPAFATDVLRAGASGIAAMGGIMRAPDPGRETEQFLAMLQMD